MVGLMQKKILQTSNLKYLLVDNRETAAVEVERSLANVQAKRRSKSNFSTSNGLLTLAKEC